MEVGKWVAPLPIEVDANALAQLFGVVPRRIRQLAEDEGMPKAGRGRYPLVACVRWRIVQLEELASGQIIQLERGGKADLRATRLRLLELDLKQRQLELAKEVGEVITVEEAVADVQRMVGHFRAKLLNLFPRLAPALGIPLAELQRKGTPALHEVMNQLAETGKQIDEEDDRAVTERRKGLRVIRGGPRTTPPGRRGKDT
jgi:phage terminase Nu1 subunit (DNA packaging protein)